MFSMNKFLASMMMMAALVGVNSASAQARLQEPLWTCGLELEVSGMDVQILVGYSRLEGAGKISCVDIAGNTEVLPVKVSMGTPVLFPRLAFAPSITIHGVATGIGLASGGPSALLGNYLVVDARLAVGAGLGGSLALLGQQNAVTINLGIQGVDGFGVAVGGTFVTLEAMH